MTLPQPPASSTIPPAPKMGRPEAVLATPAPGLTGWTFASRGGLPVADAMHGHHGRYCCLMVLA